MSQPATAPAAPVKLNVRAAKLTDEQFAQLCRENPELRLELTAQKELVILSPTGSKTGWRNSRITYLLVAWADKDGTGLAFDSSTGFTLPNGAKRSPDASWVKRGRWDVLTEEQQEGFAPLCPDFVIELRSPTDDLPLLKEKLQEYLDNGAQLGWLIDPIEKRAYVYRPNHPVAVLENPVSLTGAPVLPGFELPVRSCGKEQAFLLSFSLLNRVIEERHAHEPDSRRYGDPMPFALPMRFSRTDMDLIVRRRKLVKIFQVDTSKGKLVRVKQPL